MSVGSSANLSVAVPSPEEILAQIERILSSSSFRGSTPVQRLLRYLGRHAIEHPGETVKEYELATEGLGRSNEFDPRVDAVVRLTASRLRAKLAEYYLHDGADDAILLDIPKGVYVLDSSYRAARAELPARTETQQVATPAVHVFPWRRNLFSPWTLAAVLGLGCAMLTWQNMRLRSKAGPAGTTSHEAASTGVLSPHVEHLWRSLFPDRRQVSVVTSDANLLFLTDFMNRAASLDEYRAQGYPLNLIDRNVADLAVRQVMQEHMKTFLTTSQDSLGVADLASVMDRYRIPFKVIYARDARLAPDSEDNIVLLGNQMGNPWVELFNHKVNFVYEWNPQQKRAVLRNLSPKAGEKDVYAAKPGKSKSYATVVYAARPNGLGTVLMIGGTDATAVEVGTRFLTDETSIASLHQALGVDLAHPLPHFEVLLSARELTDIPYNFEIVAYRVLHP
ncbi:MAG TPA: hypothetical protein VFA71_15610 [Terriglobales bacterium]|nr:hypothetical protein [Terriglobales bacterium]